MAGRVNGDAASIVNRPHANACGTSAEKAGPSMSRSGLLAVGSGTCQPDRRASPPLSRGLYGASPPSQNRVCRSVVDWAPRPQSRLRNPPAPSSTPRSGSTQGISEGPSNRSDLMWQAAGRPEFKESKSRTNSYLVRLKSCLPGPVGAGGQRHARMQKSARIEVAKTRCHRRGY